MAAFYKFPKAVRELFLFHNIGFLPLFCLHFLSGSIEKRALKRNQMPPFCPEPKLLHGILPPCNIGLFQCKGLINLLRLTACKLIGINRKCVICNPDYGVGWIPVLVPGRYVILFSRD